MLHREKFINLASGYFGMLRIPGLGRRSLWQQVNEDQQPVLLMPCGTTLFSFSLWAHVQLPSSC